MKNKKYPFIGLGIGFIIGSLFSLYAYNQLFILSQGALRFRYFFYLFPLGFAISGYFLGLYVKFWKEARKKAKERESFRRVKAVEDLSPEQKNLTLRIIRLQRKLSLFYIFFSPLPLIFGLLLISKLFIAFYIMAGLLVLPAIFLLYKFGLPLMKLRFEIGERSASLLPKYLPGYRKGFKFIVLGFILWLILLYWAYASENVVFLLLLSMFIFLYIGIGSYIISKKNEEALFLK